MFIFSVICYVDLKHKYDYNLQLCLYSFLAIKNIK